MSTVTPTKEGKHNICRVCLTDVEEKSFSLFDNFKDHFVYTYIHILTDVRINKNDGYPDRICKHCILELETVIQFKERCERSNKILLLGLASRSATVEVEVPLEIKEEVFTNEESSSIKQELTDNDCLSSIEHGHEEIVALDTVNSQIASVKKELTNDDYLSHADCDDHEMVALDTANSQKVKDIQTLLQCNDCGDYFRTKCKLRVHWKKTHYAQSCIRICVRCKLSFKSLHAYQNHLKNVPKRCKALDDELISVEGQGKNRIFHCKECDYNTTYVPNILHHSAKHSGNRQYQCDLCPKAFIQYASWSKHKEYTHKQFKQIITCHYCGKLIKGSDTIKRHLKTHSEEKNFQCDICKKRYKTKCILQDHMKTHRDKNFTCEICAKVFHTPSGLWIHIQYVHKKHNRTLFKCSKCEYKTLKLYNVKKHERKHTDNNIACPQCGMFFEKAEKMLKHQRIHFEEKKFACTLCERKYLGLDSLHKHQKFAHGMKFSQ